MNRARYYENHRLARLGHLGKIAATTSNKPFDWFLREVYDVRYPHVGDDRHAARGCIASFGRQAGRLHQALVQWHRRRGWLNCWHKSLLRLWVEYKAIAFGPLEPGEKPEQPLNYV